MDGSDGSDGSTGATRRSQKDGLAVILGPTTRGRSPTYGSGPDQSAYPPSRIGAIRKSARTQIALLAVG